MSSFQIQKGAGLLSPDSLTSFLQELAGKLPQKIESPQSEIGFRPQPKQAKLIEAAGLLDWWEGRGPVKHPIAPLIGYGGAAFGAKTYGLLGLASLCAYAFPGCQITFFRRTYTELEGPGAAMFEANEVFGGIGKKRDDGKHWHFPKTGSDFYFRHCEHEEDVYKYDSQQFDILLVDQANHFTWFMIDYLITRNRVSGRSGVTPFTALSFNPGNVGHGWLVELFDLEDIKAEHLQVKNRRTPNNTYKDLYFVPAFIQDNQIGLGRDPGYEKRLRESEPDLAEALLTGNFKIFSGMAFRDFNRSEHVCEPFELPWKWPKWRAVDYGFDAPFCCLWLTKDPDIGRIYVYREVYAPGLTDKQQADLIATYSPAEEAVSITYASRDMWIRRNRDGIVSTSADEYRKNGIPLYQADNDRLNGKKKIHRQFAKLPDGKPGLVFFSNCENLIRTLPRLPRSQFNPEDVEQRNVEDHAYETLRYGLTNTEMFTRERKPKDKAASANPWKALGSIT